MKSGIKAVFLLCAAGWIASLFFVSALPEKKDIRPDLLLEPLQMVTTKEAFTVQKNGIMYTLTPLFTYELYGLLVTYHNSASWIDNSHKEWKDYLNVRDMSVIWGYNIESDEYREVTYYHGDWTGYYKYDHPVKFDGKYFANMHILPANDKIEKEIMRPRIGDQIVIKGYLVNYSRQGTQFNRMSSTTREDTGNGACEIVYVTECTILKEANGMWREINRFSKIAMICCLALLAGGFFIDAQKI